MTVNELSNLFNVSGETIKNVIRELLPEKMQKGKKTILTKDESILIGEKIRKTGYIQPTNYLQEPTNNLYVTKNDLKEFAISFAQEIIKSIAPIIKQEPTQIELKQDYFSILGYSNLKKIQITFSEAIKFGKNASSLSKELNLEVRKIPDERFGKVNSYHISILEKIFEV